MILIVEKEHDLRVSLRRMMEKENKDVTFAADWDEAQDLCVNQKPSCVITGDTELFDHANRRSIIHNLLVKRNTSVIFTTYSEIPDTIYDINVIKVLKKPFIDTETIEFP